ncbi:MAG: sugar phosphate nucleotidyltransferase [Chthoniobacterales bacterium]
MNARIRQAFVLGAGLGMRLRPLTDHLPKPLVPVFHKPLITFALDHLIAAGLENFVINTHRLPELFERAFPENSYRGRAVRLVHEPVLLETGGGIKNAEPYLSDGSFITYSGDILTDLNLAGLIDEHFERGNDVTLGLRETGLGAVVAFRDGRVLDIAKRLGLEGAYDYANIAIWNPLAFDRFPPRQKISFIPVLTDWIRDGGRVGGVVLNDGRWFNIGSPQQYLELHRTIVRERWKPGYISDPEWPQRIASTAKVDPSARLTGCSAVGADAQAGSDVSLEDSIVWSGAKIASRSHLKNCIVRTGQTAEGDCSDTII